MKRAKRKSANQAASKKKAAKKVTSKKKAVKKSGKARGRKTTVVLDPMVPLGSEKSRLSRSHGDRICWKNKDSVEHKIRFVPGEWPFTGTQHDIVAKKHKTSKALKVRADAVKDSYDYEIVPAIVYATAGTPPDGPAVIIGD